MRILINEKNADKIRKEIKETEGRATVRTIDIVDIYNACEKIPEKYGITKKALEGCQFCIDMNAQSFPGAYKYTPQSTYFTIMLESGKWYLTDLYRYNTRTKTAGQIQATLTDEAKTAIIHSFEHCSF